MSKIKHMKRFMNDDDKWRVLVERDNRADGAFFYGVLTTGIYCRPNCSSRLPNRKNVRFFNTLKEAEIAGFRPCKRCHPRNKDVENHKTIAVLKACRIMDEADTPSNLEEIAQKVGFSPYYFHRVFKKIVGVTPKQYAMEIRLKKTRAGLKSGDSVTHAIYNSGFESSSRFYEKSNKTLGMNPSAFKKGAPNIEIQYSVVQYDLGWVLVAMTEKGICSVTLGDSPEKLRKILFKSFPNAIFKEPGQHFNDIMAKVLSQIDTPKRRRVELPLDIQGTAFQRSVWEALQKIAPGTMKSYAEIAASIGKPRAVRAVAGACSANPVAVVIPCHRVVRKNGALGGYRWGIERKRDLLVKEHKLSNEANFWSNFSKGNKL